MEFNTLKITYNTSLYWGGGPLRRAQHADRFYFCALLNSCNIYTCKIGGMRETKTTNSPQIGSMDIRRHFEDMTIHESNIKLVWNEYGKYLTCLISKDGPAQVDPIIAFLDAIPDSTLSSKQVVPHPSEHNLHKCHDLDLESTV